MPSQDRPVPLFCGVDRVVGSLRGIRTAARLPGARPAPARLPSRAVLANVVAGLASALFPNRLGAAGGVGGNIDAFVARTLVNSLDALARQVRLDLSFADEESDDESELSARAISVVTAFSERLPDIRRSLDGDIDAAFAGDPAARNMDIHPRWLTP